MGNTPLIKLRKLSEETGCEVRFHWADGFARPSLITTRSEVVSFCHFV